MSYVVSVDAGIDEAEIRNLYLSLPTTDRAEGKLRLTLKRDDRAPPPVRFDLNSEIPKAIHLSISMISLMTMYQSTILLNTLLYRQFPTKEQSPQDL